MPFKVHLTEMSNSQIEIINGWERRRRWSLEEKLRIVAEFENRAPASGRWRPGMTFIRKRRGGDT